jgi:hypothetical protein
MKAERSYVVTSTTVADGQKGTSSVALTRDAIRLEVAIRLVVHSKKKVREAWTLADAFVDEMDRHLPKIPDAAPE